MNLIELKHPTMTTENTRVYYDEDSINYNAPNRYIVVDVHTGQVLCTVDFQNGPTKEVALNGIFNEDLINMVLDRIKCFNSGDMACKENEEAITKLEEALMWLRHRSNRRKLENTYGTSNGK